MARNKMEADFREKLNQREIMPSKHAWDRLDAMLTAGEEKETKPKYTWLFIAAGFIGLLLMATVFYKISRQPDTIQNEVVIENDKLPKIPTESEMQSTSPYIEEESVFVVESDKANHTRDRSTHRNVIAANENNNQIQHQVADANKRSAPSLIVPVNQLTTAIENQQLQMEQPLAYVGHNDKMVNRQKTITIDPNVLLSQVDTELNLSFRERALQVVSKNYQSVKIALAARNQE